MQKGTIVAQTINCGPRLKKLGEEFNCIIRWTIWKKQSRKIFFLLTKNLFFLCVNYRISSCSNHFISFTTAHKLYGQFLGHIIAYGYYLRKDVLFLGTYQLW